MSVSYKCRECGKGIIVSDIYDKKFKSYMIFVKFIIPPNKENEALCSLAMDIISTSNRKYPEKEQLSRLLVKLYSSSLGANYGRVSEHYGLSFTVGTNCDEYTLNGEKVSDELADILLDCIFDPLLENGGFSQKYFELCRQDILDDIDSVISNKRRYANFLFKKVAFDGESFSLSLSDYRDTLLAADPVSVYKAYCDMLRMSRIEISFCGGACPDDVKQRIIDRFMMIDRSPVYPETFIAPSPLKKTVRREEARAEANQCQLMMAYKTANFSEYASKLFCAMLSMTPTSKLYVNVREKKSLCYYCDASICDMKDTIVISTGLAEDKLEEAESVISDQLKALAEGDFSDEELDSAKLALSDAYLSNYDSKFSLYFWYNYQIHTGGYDSPEDKVRKIMELTREDIKKEAAGYKLDCVFTLKPANGGDDNEL